MNLFELTGQYLALLELAEMPDADPEVIEGTMEALDGELEEKADGYARIIAQLKADAAGLDEEINRLIGRKTALVTNAERLKRHLEAAMIATGKTKFKTTLFSFGIQKNPASVKIDDEDAIPSIYLIPQMPKIDKKGILAALKNGEKLSYAHLEQGESLRIR